MNQEVLLRARDPGADPAPAGMIVQSLRFDLRAIPGADRGVRSFRTLLRAEAGPGTDHADAAFRGCRRKSGCGGGRRVWIVGGGPMGLMAAIELADACAELGLEVEISVLEGEAFGGGKNDRASSPRCQAWFHFGALYSLTQPHVTMTLRRSGARLQELAPRAFQFPPAFAVQRAGETPRLEECCHALGMTAHRLSEAVVASWLPSMRLPAGSGVYRVEDGTMDVRLLGASLALEAQRRGVDLVRQRVSGVCAADGAVTRIVLEGGGGTDLRPGDQIVFAGGAAIRPLMESAGCEVPGLRVFQSHLIAARGPGIPALVYLTGGGVNCVPHAEAGEGLIDLFGDSRRKEIPPEQDHRNLSPNPDMVEALRAEAEAAFGVTISPRETIAWHAFKTELTGVTARSQAGHALRVPGLENGWIVIPGKLTGSAACAEDLAVRMVRELLDEPVARPHWEMRLRKPAAEASPVPERVHALAA